MPGKFRNATSVESLKAERTETAPHSSQLTDFLLRCLIALLLISQVWTFSLFSYRLLLYPYDWEPSESDHIYYATRILNGEPLYTDNNRFPLLCMNYPPGYDLLLSLPVMLFGPNMLTGRIFSLILSGLLGLIIYKVIVKETGWRFLGLVMSLSLLAYGPVSAWLTIIRMETMYVALALLGMYLLSKHEQGYGYIVLSAFCIACAFFTKQQGLFALGAGILFLLANKEYKKCAALVVLVVLLTLPLDLGLNYLTDGWYNKHLFSSHFHREFSWWRIRFLSRLVWASPVFFAAACFGIVHELKERRPSVWTTYLFCALPVALLILFEGAADNYFIPLFAGVLIVSGLGIGKVIPIASRNGLTVGKTWLYLLIVFQLITFTAARSQLRGPTKEDRMKLDLVQSLIRNTEEPVLVDRMSSLIIGTKKCDYFTEPVVLMYLYLNARWDPNIIVSAVNERKFSLICMFDETQFVPPVISSIRANYVPLLSIPVRTIGLDTQRYFTVYGRRQR